MSINNTRLIGSKYAPVELLNNLPAFTVGFPSLIDTSKEKSLREQTLESIRSVASGELRDFGLWNQLSTSIHPTTMSIRIQHTKKYTSHKATILAQEKERPENHHRNTERVQSNQRVL